MEVSYSTVWRNLRFFFYDTLFAMRLAISMSGSIAFKRCILGALAALVLL